MKTINFIFRNLKRSFFLIFMIITTLSITSCSNSNFNAVSKLYVQNNVDKEIKILVNYSGNSIDSTVAYLNPNQGFKLVSMFEDENYERFCGKNTNRKIYIYNYTDSTYYQVSSSAFNSDPTPNFIKTNDSEEIDKDTQTITYNYYITVNDSLIAKMQKIRS